MKSLKKMEGGAEERKGASERIESGRRRVSLNERRVRRGTVARPTLRRSNFDPCRARFPFCLCTQVWHRSRIGFVPSARDGASMTRDTRTKRKRVVAPPLSRRPCFRPSFLNSASAPFYNTRRAPNFLPFP